MHDFIFILIIIIIIIIWFIYKLYRYWNIEARHQYLNMFGDTHIIRSSPLSPFNSCSGPGRDKSQVQEPHFVSTWNEVEIKSLSAQLVINLTASSPCLNSHYPNLLRVTIPLSNQISKLKFRSLNTRPSMFSSLFSPRFLFPLLSFHHRWLTPTRKPRPSDNILE